MTDPARFSVEITEAVARDLEGIVAHLIEQGALGPANALIAEFRQRVLALERFPRRGAVPKEIESVPLGEVRQLVMPPYRIFYRILGTRVAIILLADGRRDLRALLRQRLFNRDPRHA